MRSSASLAIEENIQTWFGRGFLKIHSQLIFSNLFVFPEHTHLHFTEEEIQAQAQTVRKDHQRKASKSRSGPGGGDGGRWHFPFITLLIEDDTLPAKSGRSDFFFFLLHKIKNQKGNKTHIWNSPNIFETVFSTSFQARQHRASVKPQFIFHLRWRQPWQACRKWPRYGPSSKRGKKKKI